MLYTWFTNAHAQISVFHPTKPRSEPAPLASNLINAIMFTLQQLLLLLVLALCICTALSKQSMQQLASREWNIITFDKDLIDYVSRLVCVYLA